MKTLGSFLVVTIALAMLMAVMPASAAAPVITAQHDFFTASGMTWMQPFYPNYIIAQTFVPKVSGRLQSIDTTVHTYYLGDTKGIPISFELRSVWDSGMNGWQPDRRPGVAPLATGSVSSTNADLNDDFIKWVNVSMTPCDLQAGQMYAIVASALGTGGTYEAYDWYAKGTDGAAYPDGRLLVGYNGDAILGQQSYDLPFRVLVTPEPGSLLALGSGLIGLLGLRFRRK